MPMNAPSEIPSKVRMTGSEYIVTNTAPCGNSIETSPVSWSVAGAVWDVVVG